MLGWIRTAKVMRSEDGSAHPHYHALLMVPGHFFAGRRAITSTKRNGRRHGATRCGSIMIPSCMLSR